MQEGISKPTLLINNETIAIVPNSATFDEGEGETTVRAMSAGGGSIELVISTDAEGMVGGFKVELPNTAKYINLARGWKKNPGKNVIQMLGNNKQGKPLSRTITEASITNNYEVELSSDGKLSLEWVGMPPI